ncbi:MAG: asparaginase [Patescibacteria group bacterium]
MRDKKQIHIHIIGHGGTIGMEEVLYPDGAKVRMPARGAKDLLKKISKSVKEKTRFTYTDFENVDSSNLNPFHWSKLAQKIAKIQQEKITDAVIVTHGTDTMAYHTSAISLAFGKNLTLPVIFTGSQKPQGQAGSDATLNLEEAIMAAKQAISLRLSRVLLVFNNKVFLGSRVVKVNESRFDAFDSPAFPLLGEFVSDGITWSPVAEAMALSDKKIKKKTEIMPDFDFNVVTIEITPGLNPLFPRAILETGACMGLILKSFGAGNVPDTDYSYIAQKTNLIPLIREATNKYKIPVLVTTQFMNGSTNIDQYGPGKAALSAGALETKDMTHTMAAVKLMWLLGQSDNKTLESVRQGMLENVIDEVSVKKNTK